VARKIYPKYINILRVQKLSKVTVSTAVLRVSMNAY